MTYTVGGAGLINGDSLTGALATAAALTTGVGPIAITQGSLAANANYSTTYVGANLTIIPRPLTLTADALSRVYGEANPALTYTVGGSGLINGDALTGALATLATPATGVGTAAITQGSLTAGANYSTTFTGANLTITPRPILVTADALSRIYGNANPALTYTVGGSGLVNGDALTGALATPATPITGIGIAAITQGSLAAGANYSATFTGANLTITPRPITLIADALSRIYGNANPALTYTVGGSGLVNGDALTGALANSATPTTGVGTTAITQGSLAANANYSATYVGADLTITPRPLILKADALSRVYGEANPALTYTVGGSGLVNGDTMTGALAHSATLTTGVGATAITQGSMAASANYGVTYVGADLTITPRPIILKADSFVRLFGNANPELTYKISGAGLVNADILTGALSTTATRDTGVGVVPITQGSLAANSNYGVTFADADLTILGLTSAVVDPTTPLVTTGVGVTTSFAGISILARACPIAVTEYASTGILTVTCTLAALEPNPVDPTTVDPIALDFTAADILARTCPVSAAGVCLPPE